MRERICAFVARHMPWYDDEAAQQRDDDAEKLRQRSIRARIRAERIQEQYRDADKRLGRMSGR